MGLLPPVLRRANTSFVNLRLALDDVDPLVNATKPLLPKLRPVFAETRRLAADSRPALARPAHRAEPARAANNDLLELLARHPAAGGHRGDARRSGRSRPGGRQRERGPHRRRRSRRPATALKAATPVIGFGRPYTTDFLGWLDDFSTTGGFFDALGASTRVFISLAENTTGGPPKREQFRRCPGGAEVPARDGSNVLSAEEQRALNCTESAQGDPMRRLVAAVVAAWWRWCWARWR